VTRRHELRRDERGFTLVELLVAIAITSFIFAPITGAIIIGLRTTNTSSQRLSQTRDIELVQGSLPADVVTAQQVWSGVPGCGGVQSLLKLTWSTPTLATPTGGGPPTTSFTNYEVDYLWQATSPATTPATYSLVRKFYTGSCASTPATRVLATSLSTTAPTVVLSGNTVKLTLTDSSGAPFAACAQMRAPATTTTVAGTTTTTMLVTCSG
jgi:prepilin-type N-terminal cleavage/methylation domain-containing protein